MNKKLVGILSIALLSVVALAGCGANKDNSSQNALDDKKIIIGASPTPHAEILEHVKDKLAKEGYTLEVKVFDDYILPNKALQDGSINANYYQHIPYLEKQIKENGYDFVNAGAVHLEPIGFYSKTLKDIKDLKDGSTVITSNSESDWGRLITILKDAGLVDVKEGVDLTTATFDDITKNPKHLKFHNELNPELLTTAYKNNEAPLIAINANFAINAGLNPTKDSLLLEKDDSPYVNVIAVRKGDQDKPAIKALIKALHEKDVENWILDKWNGSVKPVPADSK